MPWTKKDAKRHTRLASTDKLKRLWAKVANATRRKTGSDMRAIRAADSVVRRARRHKKL